MAKFTHLHLHTEYSLLDGLSKITPLLDHIKANNMDSVAITDHGTMYGAIEFYKKANAAGIKPIIGCEAYITNVDHKLRGDRDNTKNYHLLLLAKNEEGYKNMMQLTSIAHTEGFYYRPRFDHDTLKKFSKGIIATSACVQSELSQSILNDGVDGAKKVLNWYLDVFGEDFYLEVQRHRFSDFINKATIQEIKTDIIRMTENEKKLNDGILKLSREFGIPIIATNDAHYITRDDATAQDALVCVATGKNVNDVKRMRYIDTPSFYVTSPDEMLELFSDIPEVLENTQKIVNKCELEIALGTYHFPKVQLPKGITAEDEVVKKVYEGIKWRYGKVTPELKERADKELKVINEKGYAPYFLIFEDMAKWSIERLIPINIRGSVAGSIVSYCLGITTVDPIRFNLPFERFLNPMRPSAPDIDMDIADDMRGEMIGYLKNKYGEEKVAQICTFGRMLARGSVRDIARVLGYPYEIGDRISKLIPMGSQGFPMTIERALKESNELKRLYDEDKDAKKIIDLAHQVEGNARHVSVHAGGVVVAPSALTDFTPLQVDTSEERKLITQYEMHAIEDVGLVKLDVLGIRNLSILREAVVRVKNDRNTAVDLSKIPLDDTKTFEMLSRGETMGVFQLSGSGMTRYLVDMEPHQIEDIMMMIALFRPGPMNNIDEYISRKKGKKKIEYYHPKMEKFLDKSLGVLVYQDDLLYTAIEVAGYNWEEVDKFRKAVGKKIPEEMARQHEIFVQGCMDNSQLTKEAAEGLWKLFEPFQGYGFNKAHSASYGMVAYQTAYMKSTYPVEYMAALLTAESGDTDKVAMAIGECKRMGIKVLPPNINESAVGFNIIEDDESLDKRAIVFGLSAIKNVGVAAIEAILAAREAGIFSSFSDFCNRIDARRVNKKVMESLIKVGALSMFGNRAGLLEALEEVRSSAKGKNTSQQSLFGGEDSEAAAIDQIQSTIQEFEEPELQKFERELLGFTLTGENATDVLSTFHPYTTHKIDEIKEGVRLPEEIKIAGIIKSVRKVTTKNGGKEMAFGTLDDGTGELGLVIFPKIYSSTRDIWEGGRAVLVSGSVDFREDTPSILVNVVHTPESLEPYGQSAIIAIPSKTSNQTLTRLKNMLKKNEGMQTVILEFSDPAKTSFQLPFAINWSDKLKAEVDKLLQ